MKSHLPLIEASFHQLPFPAFIYDNVPAVVAVNQAGKNLLGTSSEFLAGRPCAEVFHCRSCDHACSVLDRLRQGTASSGHTARIITHAGREQLAFVTVSRLLDSAGHVQGTLAIFTSVIEPPLRQRQSMIAESNAMCVILDFARRVAASEAATVLVDGESGTGKELVARILHDDSRRSRQPFVAINCAAMPETRLESELFGYEKGAFTDARSPKPGLFELANTGTLFLDEIGELPLKLQAKLLRVLDERSFRRLGGLVDIQSDLRIVAATNRDLRLAVAQGEFRLDLYYRLNIIQLTIPPLRERREDILPLARFFLDHFSRKFQRSAQALPAETARLLFRYDWPGNVRELRNLIERSVLLAETATISAACLPAYVQSGAAPAQPLPASPMDQDLSLKASETLLIANAMTKSDGNQTRAAKLLGISRDALRYRLSNCHRPSVQYPKKRPSGSLDHCGSG
ncbi:MAG: sigma 54-interacting transcriptional regulator [Acidobacteria bacterium]|nr:sigma 54-interacting transcriptional regulator [Acidobacteriota bacterium]